jgi:hypothetical protein
MEALVHIRDHPDTAAVSVAEDDAEEERCGEVKERHDAAPSGPQQALQGVPLGLVKRRI